MAGYIQFKRSEATLNLIQHPKELALLSLIAHRARWSDDGINSQGLERGQALIGDPQAAGLTRQQYRTSLKRLRDWNLIATKSTNRGTIATLLDSTIFAITDDRSNQPATSQQPASNQLATSQQPLTKKGKREKGNNTHTHARPSDLDSRILKTLALFGINTEIWALGETLGRFHAQPQFFDDEAFATLKVKAPAWLKQKWIRDVSPKLIAEHLSNIYHYQPNGVSSRNPEERYAGGF